MGKGVQAFFLPADRGARFVLFQPAQRDVSRGTILYVHPFAEEMNKARRMAALQTRAFADAGYDVMRIDLYGCGDSSGDSGRFAAQPYEERGGDRRQLPEQE